MSQFVLYIVAWVAKWTPAPVKHALYKIQPVAVLIRRLLNRAAPTGLTAIEIAAGGLAGYKLLLELQSEKDYWLGTYETDLQDAIADLARKGMIAYDIGANIGYISLLLARAVGKSGRVFSFEALPANLERLRMNIELNALQSQIQIAPFAVIDETKKVEFLVGPSGGMGKAVGSTGRTEYVYGEKIEVQGISLDQFVYQDENPIPDLIKLDIEGGETLALPGMRRLLAEAKPVVLLELHGEQAAAIAWQILNQSGYRICLMKAGYPPVVSLQSLGWKAYLVALPPDR